MENENISSTHIGKVFKCESLAFPVTLCVGRNLMAAENPT
jgi:hypothetical protein